MAADFTRGETFPSNPRPPGTDHRHQLAQPQYSAEIRGAALASWSYIHGLASLMIHGVIQVPEAVSDERLVELTLGDWRGFFGGRERR